jgi:hypothetical protein
MTGCPALEPLQRRLAVGVPGAESKKIIAGRFGVSEDQVRQIEEQGLEGGWPPLVQ